MLNQDLTAVRQIQRFSMRCSWIVGSEEVGLEVALRQCSCIVRVVENVEF